MNIPNKAEVIAHLRGLADGSLVPIPSEGICWNLAKVFNTNFASLYDLMEGWPEHSGSRCYPIKHTTKGPDSAFYSQQESRELWTGEQGSARRRLCVYIADKLESES